MTRNKSTTVARKAEFVRELLSSLLRNKVKTGSQKESLATAIGKSRSVIDQMMYYGEGGLDIWIAALMHCYSIDEQTIANMVLDYQEVIRKIKPLTAADKEWFKLSELFTDNELLVEARLIRARAEIEQNVGLRPKGGSERSRR